MTNYEPAKKLQDHRPLLLALEAIGWLHMTGKAKVDFLRAHGGQNNGYDYKKWHEQEKPLFPWNELLQWVQNYCQKSQANNIEWPTTLTAFISEHADSKSKPNLVGLLQAGHAMASGIEKNLPSDAAKYLGQDATHMWLSSAFGHPVRNLLVDPPELLTECGWKCLLGQIERLLSELERLSENSPNDIDGWWGWRDGAVGPDGWLRKAFTSTLAETRLPNNDVTLFDQSYVAAALFKSAAAGAMLEGGSFPWSSNLKQETRWRLLTIGIGADHYEARAVKIGDWNGARWAIDGLFNKVCRLVEVDLAVGSLLYRDGEVCVFSFPGERFGYNQPGYQGGDLQNANWKTWLTEQIDDYEREANFETPPYCQISEPSRSLVGMTAEIAKARKTMAVPLHRNWQIPGQNSPDGHVCPVCLVRRNNSATDKQKTCTPCEARRTDRLNNWLEGEFGSDTIWIDEVADANDRVALVTMSLDIKPWLDGTRLDSLRTQAIPEWSKNSGLKQNPIKPDKPYETMLNYTKRKLAAASFPNTDNVFSILQAGFSGAGSWEKFFSDIVEDRADAPIWNELDDDKRAKWLAHQLFRKFASPGRIYRFERQSEEFFKSMLDEFREIADVDQNRWRVRRLVVRPGNGSSGPWKDRQTYEGRHRDAPIILLYREQTQDFLTICNLARLSKPEKDKDCLSGTLELKADDSKGIKRLTVQSTEDATGAPGIYHPVIPLELSPVRFRVLLPLEAASTCVDRAIEAWRDQFAHVWDRLPLRIGIVAFPRMTPFQAVIEAARTVESELERNKETETVEITGCGTREGFTSLNLKSRDGQSEIKIPVHLPDEREDVFYPYFAVEDKQVRFPRDFQHPDGQVFRHTKDLRNRDRIFIYPSLITTLFMDDTARRFETLPPKQLTEWQRMRELWRLMDSSPVPSQTAIRGAWSELAKRREDWQKPDGTWFDGGKAAWLDFARAVFHKRLGVQRVCLETLVQSVDDELLEWSLEWHMRVLKKQVSGGKYDNK